MRNFDDVSDIDRDCNNCGASDWNIFEEKEYGGDRGNNVAKTYFSCASCNAEGRLYEENHNIQWSGNLR